MSVQQQYKHIGSRPERPDGTDKVTGRANFGADLTLPGLCWGAVLRSPHAHARIKSIDTSAAKALTGVVAVITGADMPKIAGGKSSGGEAPAQLRDLSQNVLAWDKALYHGHAVAAVAATSKTIAQQALALIQVDYEVLAPVMDITSAIDADACVLHTGLRTKGIDSDAPTNVAAISKNAKGDIEQGFSDADTIIERVYKTAPVHQGYIEPHAVVASTNESNQTMVWVSTQGHFAVRSSVCEVLGLELNDVKVVAAEIGGGFGGKTTVYLEPLAVLMSRISCRPIKMTMTREEVFRATGPTSATEVRLKLAATKDGQLIAAKAELKFEAGAFPGSSVGTAMMCIFAPYKLDNFYVEGWDVLVNKPKYAAYRAPGAPMVSFAMESALDELAQALAIDPLQLRLLNSVKEGDVAAYGPKFKAIGMVECLQAAQQHAHWRSPVPAGQGRGMAVGFWFNAGMQSSAQINLTEKGDVMLMTGSPDIGGSRASMAMLAAEELGIDLARVNSLVADTENSGFSDVTGGSRVTFATGMAVIQASKDVLKQLIARAAATWGLQPEQVSWQEGQAVDSTGANETLSLRQICEKAGRTGGPIGGRASLTAKGAGPSFSVNIVDTEVDSETGHTLVKRFTAIQDAGKAIHPDYVEGQMQGGAVQGIGWALNEAFDYDADGKLLNAGFLDYRVPVASDLPMIDTQIVEVANPSHPYGVRGVGETPIVAPLAAVANAVSRTINVRLPELPLQPHTVLAAVQGAA